MGEPMRPHGERDHVHGAAAHRAAEQLGERGPHLVRVVPVVGRPGVQAASREQMKVRSSTRATSLGSERARKLLGRFSGSSAREGARLDQLAAERLVLLVGAVAPVDVVGLSQRRDLVDPRRRSASGTPVGWHPCPRSPRFRCPSRRCFIARLPSVPTRAQPAARASRRTIADLAGHGRPVAWRDPACRRRGGSGETGRARAGHRRGGAGWARAGRARAGRDAPTRWTWIGVDRPEALHRHRRRASCPSRFLIPKEL